MTDGLRKDAEGQEVKLGDYLALASGGRIYYGRVTNFTPKGVTIAYCRKITHMYDDSGKLVKAPEPTYPVSKKNTTEYYKIIKIHEMGLPQRIFEILDALEIK